MTFPDSFLDELRGRVGLVQIVSRRVKLKKAGHEWKGCCPFHNEKTPSFYINEEKQFYHCLADETEVITAAGVRPIAELAGGSHRLLTTGGQWVDAPVRSFGMQRLWRITLSRNGTEKVIHATDGHRWFVRGRKAEVRTDELHPGHRLESVLPEPGADWTLDPAGIRHGIVYGKGTAGGGYHQMNLDDELYAAVVHLFPGSGHRRVDKAGRYRPIYIGKGYGDLKAPPRLDAPRAYLLGFLAGYIAADGHASSDDGRVTLHSKARRHLEIARDIATVAGIGTFGIAERERSGFGSPPTIEHRISFVASTLDPALFILPRHREHFERRRVAYERLRWQVRSVEPTERVEEVFCAEVEGTHAFALEGNILTGNCFGCGVHGDVIRFVCEQDGLRFPEAVRQLAGECGLPLPEETPEARARDERRSSLTDIMAQAQRWYAEQLQGLAGADARRYLADRGMTPETIDRFGIGFAPAGNKLLAALSRIDPAGLQECGLIGRSEARPEPYDRFRNRIVFPIRDGRGQVVGFGGRILGEGGPKYLNSPDTPLFDKGRLLYNLDRAAPAARRIGRLLVVEGYTDVTALAQVGIEEAVAPLGTALTEDQMRLLWRAAPEPTLCFDGDTAGDAAAVRAAAKALPLLEPGISLRFVTLPAGQDPDDLAREKGKAGVDALLSRAEPLIDRLWRAEMEGADLSTPERRADANRRLREHVETIRHPNLRRLYAEDFRTRFDALFTQRRDPRQQARPANLRHDPADAEACALIQAALQVPGLIDTHFEKLAELATADRHAAAVLQAINEAAGAGDTEHLAERLRVGGMGRELDHVAAGAGRLSAIATRCFGDMLAIVADRRRVDADLAAATARLAAGGGESDFEAQRALAAEREALAGRLREMVA